MEFKFPIGKSITRSWFSDREPRHYYRATSPERRVEPVDHLALVDGMKQETPPVRLE